MTRPDLKLLSDPLPASLAGPAAPPLSRAAGQPSQVPEHVGHAGPVTVSVLDGLVRVEVSRVPVALDDTDARQLEWLISRARARAYRPPDTVWCRCGQVADGPYGMCRDCHGRALSASDGDFDGPGVA